MARDGKEQRIREVERCIEIWKENQWKHSADSRRKSLLRN